MRITRWTWVLLLIVAVALVGCGVQESEIPTDTVKDADGTPQPTPPPPAPAGKAVVADGQLASPYSSLALAFGGHSLKSLLLGGFGTHTWYRVSAATFRK